MCLELSTTTDNDLSYNPTLWYNWLRVDKFGSVQQSRASKRHSFLAESFAVHERIAH